MTYNYKGTIDTVITNGFLYIIKIIIFILIWLICSNEEKCLESKPNSTIYGKIYIWQL